MHKLSHDIVAMASVVVTEKLDIKKMTMTGKGTEEKPGKDVKQKARMNRSILDSAPGMLYDMTHSKCNEAEIKFIEVDTIKVKPSQTCANCGFQQKMDLSKREYICKKCNWICDRDENSTLVMLHAALG